MRILIVSDNHRRMDNFIQVIKQVGPIDLLIHCGDADGSEGAIHRAAGCEMEIVGGNNDYMGWAGDSSLPMEREFMLGPYKVWLVHGHRYHVNAGDGALRKEAQARGVDIVMYGHTHRPCVDIRPGAGLAMINPGSLAQPRQDGHRPSYIIMEIDGAGMAHYTVNYL